MPAPAGSFSADALRLQTFTRDPFCSNSVLFTFASIILVLEHTLSENTALVKLYVLGQALCLDVLYCLQCNFMSHKPAEILSSLPSLAAGVRGASTVRAQLRAAPISSRAKLCQMSPTYSSLDHTSPVKAFMSKACTSPPHSFQIKFSEVVMMFCSRPCRFFLHGNSEGNHSPHFHFALLLFIKRYCE